MYNHQVKIIREEKNLKSFNEEVNQLSKNLNADKIEIISCRVSLGSEDLYAIIYYKEKQNREKVSQE